MDIDQLLLSTYPPDLPGASIAILKGTSVILCQSFGLAKLAPATEVVQTTLFRAGSLTKQLTAALILQMVAEGSLALASSVSNLTSYCRGFPASLEVKHLLSHTSMIPSASLMERYKLWYGAAAESIYEWIENSTPTGTPGEAWVYSDYNYVLLGLIAETILGCPLAEAFRSRFFEHLELPPQSHYQPTIERSDATALDYFHSSTGYYPVRWSFLRPPLGEAGLVTTANEYACWLQAYLKGAFFSKNLLSLATTRFKLNNGDLAPFGFAWFISDYHGETILEHGGAVGGYRGHALVLPKSQLIIVILCNSVDHRPTPSYLAFKIAAHFLGKPHNVLKVHMSDSHRANLEGSYGGSRGMLTLENSAGRLLCKIDQGHCRELFWQGDKTYALENTLSSIEITSIERNSPRTLRMTHRFMPPDTYSRVS